MKQYKMKVCLSCGKQYRPASGHQQWCFACVVQHTKKQKAEHHTSRLVEDNAWQRDYWFRNGLKIKYGITRDEYDALLVSQGGKCAACGATLRPNSDNNKNGQTCVDHDHATGKVRGLLCPNCNIALGHAHDDPTILLKLVTYLTHNTP